MQAQPSTSTAPSTSSSTAAPPNPDNLKDKILTTLGGDDPVIMAFSNLSIDDIKSNVDKLIRESVHDKTPEVRKHALDQISLALQEVNVNPVRVKMLLGILSTAVQDGTLSGKEVFDVLKDLLNTDIESLSMELLNFFDVLIGCTHHKRCQEIFTNCLQETSKLPSVLTGSHRRISNKINSMMKKLLDRNNLVMPPICSYCDIMYALNNKQNNWYPHWSVTELLNDYVSTFNCLTDLMTIENTEHFRPVIRHSFQSPTGWRLDPTSLIFHTVDPRFFVLQFSGPYSKPQTDLMLYTLKQVSCRDFVFNTMLQLRQGKGTICPVLLDVFMKLIKQTASSPEKEHDLTRMKTWERFGGELSSLIFCSAIHIQHLTEALLKELKDPATFASLQQHRDFLMWTLHRFFSFCLKIVRIPKKEFLFIGEIIKLLYPEQQPLPVPDRNSPLSVVYLSAASMWAIFATRSADNPGIQDVAPIALIEQLNYLHTPLVQQQFSTSDFSVCISLNHINNFVPSFSNTSEAYSRPLRYLMESVYTAQQTTVLPGNVQVVAALTPIPLDILDLLTAHAKLNFVVTITNHITKMADPHDQMTQSSNPYLAPALLETFSRLLCYTEIDYNCPKMLMTLIQQVFSYHAYGILCSLMEMVVHRMQYVKQTMHRMNMLTHFVGFTQRVGNHPQMLYMLESFTIRLLPLLNYQDQTRISASQSGTKILSTSTEELNKLFILTAARNIVVSGNKMGSNSWLKPFMEHMTQYTPQVREWSPYTLAYFPPCFKNHYCTSEQPVSYPAKNLAMMVTEELNRTSQAGAKHDFVKYYKESDHNEIFLCILLRKIVDSDTYTLPNYALKVTQNWTPAQLKSQIRNMIDFIVLEVKNNKVTSQNIFNKIANAVNDFVFRHHMMPFDTLIFILALRKYSDQDANISLYLIHNLLVGKTQFSSRCADFVQHATPDFWRSIDWAHVHTAYHNKFPEHQYWMKKDNFAERGAGNFILPTYYSNLCLRFVPILDIVIHRLIELPPKNCRKWLVEILRVYSRLFAYHDSPITFLHDTLFYYDVMLATEFDFEKRVLVRSYLEHLTCKPMEFLSPQFIKYLNAGENDPQNWSPSPGYFLELVNHMNDVIRSSDMPEFSHIDWRFNEFGNAVCMMLYLRSIELMCIPLPANKMSANKMSANKMSEEYLAEHRMNIGGKLVDIALNNNTGQLPELCNTLGIILSALPVSFSKAVYRKIVDILRDGSNFYEVEGNVGGILWNNKAQNVLILVHSFFQHCKTDKIGYLPEFITQNISLFTTESHVVYILKLVSPFLCQLTTIYSRISPVRNQTLCALYQVMMNLLSENTVSNPDLFVDYMYYNKYIYPGAEFKPLIEKHLPTLPADFSSKLKFLFAGADSAS